LPTPGSIVQPIDNAPHSSILFGMRTTTGQLSGLSTSTASNCRLADLPYSHAGAYAAYAKTEIVAVADPNAERRAASPSR
jgi:hypothetical protein